MRKIIAVVLILLVALFLVGCAKKAEWSKAAPAGQEGVNEEETSLDADVAGLDADLGEDVSGLDSELDGLDEDLENI